MKKTILAFGILLSANAFADNNYNVLITKEHNKYIGSSGSEPEPPESGIGNICKIQLTNLAKGGTWGATLNQFELYTSSGVYDYGDITNKIGIKETHFDNMILKTTYTYSNSNLYQPEYAFSRVTNSTSEKYWLSGSNSANYTITFPNGADITSFEYSDWGRYDSWARNYTIQVFDCDDVLLREHYVSGTLSSVQNEIVSFNLSDLDLPN